MYMDLGVDEVTSSRCLAPGFRFHPTDEELVRYYLRRRISSKPFRFDAISDIDIYKSEPWELPGMSKLKSRDLEWYFFTVLDKKYSNGAKTNRATENGYWKTTGKDRPVFHRTKTVGMKKTLVYHSGRAPKGARSNWVMHEYRLVDEELDKAGICPKDAFVLCRVFQKSGTGPKNGEQYGAPLVEDEWENFDSDLTPEVATAELAIADNFSIDGDELEQFLTTEIPSEEVQLPESFYYGDDGNQIEHPENFIDDPQNPLLDNNGCSTIPEEHTEQKLFYLPVESDMDMKIVKHEFIGESSNSLESEDVDYLIDEPFLDAMTYPPTDDLAFLETDDLSIPVEDKRSSFDRVEDYLNFFNESEDVSLSGTLDPSKTMQSENILYDQIPLVDQDVNYGAPQENAGSELVLQGKNKDVASTSNHEPSYLEPSKDKNFSDIKYPPFLKQAGCMLGKMPSKGLSLGTSHSSSSIHVTAGIIRIENMSISTNGIYWSPGKNLEVNIVFSFGDSQVNEDDGGTLSSKSAYLMSPIWYNLMLLIWVIILPLSLKMGTLFYIGKAL